MARGDTPVSPYVWDAHDNEQDVISITVAYDNTTKAITGITSFRSANCAYTRIQIDRGPDGTPDTTDKVISVPSGTRNLTPAQLSALAAKGLATIDDLLKLQITAAP
jgi:hypothetical protein